nr:MAG TPA: hypothetical protein [Caudoviricetes sp.]
MRVYCIVSEIKTICIFKLHEVYVECELLSL